MSNQHSSPSVPPSYSPSTNRFVSAEEEAKLTLEEAKKIVANSTFTLKQIMTLINLRRGMYEDCPKCGPVVAQVIYASGNPVPQCLICGRFERYGPQQAENPETFPRFPY